MKPILFSTPMVQAILDGRKTQTRRVVKPQPHDVPQGSYMDRYNGNYNAFTLWTHDNRMCLGCGGNVKNAAHWKADYQPGNTLWVRETWARDYAGHYIYKADYNERGIDELCLKFKPSIHMPREAARLFLRVADVRVERLQKITPEDIASEGLPSFIIPPGHEHYKNVCGVNWLGFDGYHELWDSLSAKRGYGWDTNPWVWVYSFERCDNPQ